MAKTTVKIITAKDLPLACPQNPELIWNLHQRVFLPIEKTEDKKLVCPYCSTEYHLQS